MSNARYQQYVNIAVEACHEYNMFLESDAEYYDDVEPTSEEAEKVRRIGRMCNDLERWLYPTIYTGYDF